MSQSDSAPGAGVALRQLVSQIDKSVNFVEQQLTGFIESRYVRKVDDYYICYLSSQTGCNRGCKFCHLTATGQTTFEDVKLHEFMIQYHNVRAEYNRSNVKAKWVHFNFMARGEPLANGTILHGGNDLLEMLGKNAIQDGVKPKFNISTIMPMTLKKSLTEIFPLISPTIYYSLYSVNEKFRSEWLPTAMPIKQALDMLKEYQDFSKKIVKIHHTFIKDANDSIAEVEYMCDALDAAGLVCEFNLVRYNPFSPEQGEESSGQVLSRNMGIIKSRFKGKTQIIPRVGFDVKASCGMFVEK